MAKEKEGRREDKVRYDAEVQRLTKQHAAEATTAKRSLDTLREEIAQSNGEKEGLRQKMQEKLDKLDAKYKTGDDEVHMMRSQTLWGAS